MPRELVPVLLLLAIVCFSLAASMMHLLHPGMRRIPIRKCITLAITCVVIMMVLAPGLYKVASAVAGSF